MASPEAAGRNARTFLMLSLLVAVPLACSNLNGVLALPRPAVVRDGRGREDVKEEKKEKLKREAKLTSLQHQYRLGEPHVPERRCRLSLSSAPFFTRSRGLRVVVSGSYRTCASTEYKLSLHALFQRSGRMPQHGASATETCIKCPDINTPC